MPEDILIDRIHEFAPMGALTALLGEDHRVHVVCRREAVKDRSGRVRECRSYYLELDDEAGAALASMSLIPKGGAAPLAIHRTPGDEAAVEQLADALIEASSRADALEQIAALLRSVGMPDDHIAGLAAQMRHLVTRLEPLIPQKQAA